MEKSVVKDEKNTTSAPTECFSAADFTTPHYVSTESDTPMWWKVVETPSLTYSEYKKNKKRKARHLKELEEYLATASEERRKHAERLKQEEERYEEELKTKDEAYKARAKKYELELMIEAEEREKKLLEELEEARKKAREEALMREVERNRRLEEARTHKAEQRRKTLEHKAAIERERLAAEAEAERIKAEAEAEKEKKKEERRIESARIKEIKQNAEKKEADELNAERLKQAKIEAEEARRAQLKLDEELRIERERVEAEIAERERVKAEHKKEEERARREEERIQALRKETEKKTIATMRRNHKIRDVEFSYPPIRFDVEDDQYPFILRALELKSRSGEKLSKTFNVVAPSGLTVIPGMGSSDMHDLSTLIGRKLGGDVLKGGIKVGSIHGHTLKAREYIEALEKEAYIMDYAIEDNTPSGSVQKYVESIVGTAKVDSVKHVLGLLGESANNVIKSSFSRLSISTVSKVMIACALNTQRRVVVLFEPKRTLDMMSANVLTNLLKEYKLDKDRAFIVFTGDKVGAK